LIFVPTGRLLGDQHDRGTKAKSITLCDEQIINKIFLYAKKIQVRLFE